MPTRREIRKKIERLMEKAKSKSPGSTVRITENADGTIDAEIIMPVGRGTAVRDPIRDLEDTFRDNRIPNTFYSSGFRFEPSTDPRRDKSPFDTHRGNYQIFTRYYRYAPDSNATFIAISDQLRKKGYRKPHQAVIRLHWSRAGQKPKDRK